MTAQWGAVPSRLHGLRIARLFASHANSVQTIVGSSHLVPPPIAATANEDQSHRLAPGQGPILTMVDVSKNYGPTHALTRVNLAIPKGSCLALVGENGAGKSTLVKILTGAIQPTDGHLEYNGQKVHLSDPRRAQSLGIRFIPQELAYYPHLSVAENLALPRWPEGGHIVTRRREDALAETMLAQLGLNVDLHASMETLGLAERQLVEITKALSADAAVILLDEPTAALHPDETDRLHELLRNLKTTGVALVYVSHNLDDCFAVADEIAVLRNGYVVDQRPVSETDRPSTVKSMLGETYQMTTHRETKGVARANSSSSESRVVLRASDWHTTRPPFLRSVSFHVEAGEILTFYGQLGSGVELIARALAGAASQVSGTVEVGGVTRKAPRTPGDARRMGIGYVPAERKTDGIAPARSVSEHVTMLVSRRCSRLGVVLASRERDLASNAVERFEIRCRHVGQKLAALSGGNQQKVLLASRLISDATILVLHEPTRGVDVGARAHIHSAIADAARNDRAVVVITSDLDEAVELADRMLVVAEGRIRAELTGQEIGRQAVLQAASYAGEQEETGNG